MVLVTHEMGFAREIADRICFLDEGKLIEDAPPSVFFTTPKSARAREFLEKVMYIIQLLNKALQKLISFCSALFVFTGIL